MGRPPKTSKEQILAAAAGSDPATLQLTTLAEELGISVKTVYYYFPNRRALLDALTERAVADFGLPDVARCGTWREVLTDTARWAHRIAGSEPTWRPDAAAPQGAAIELIRVVHARLVELGWSDTDAFRGLVLVTTWAFAVGQSAAGTTTPDPLQFENFTDPDTVARLVDHLSTFTREGVFADGLAIVLAGIERECAPAQAGWDSHPGGTSVGARSR